ncbi:MAG: hypothetical protein SFU98_07055 [Leptospiraceae bacterium]|nr:hypothetical protein [Leptospiraceae bacterium]
MSTDLYGVRIEKIKDTKVQLRIFNVYGDFVGIPASKDFFLRVLSGWSVRHEKSPVWEYLGDDVFNDEQVYFRADEFVAEAKVLETKNYPGILKQTFYYCKNSKWKDEKKLPQILFELTVTDKKWISHLQERDSWGSTAYETGDYRILQGSDEEWRTFFKTFLGNNTKKTNPSREDIDQLIEGLKYEKPFIVWSSAEILGELGEKAQKAVPELMKKMASSNLDIFGYSARALGKIGDKRAIDVLLPSLAANLTRLSECVIATVSIGMIAPKNTICVDGLKRILSGAFVTYDHNQTGYVGVKASEELKTAAAFALYRITREEKYLKKWMKGLYGNYKSNGVVADSLEGASEELLQTVKPFIKKYLKSNHKNVLDWKEIPFWEELVNS